LLSIGSIFILTKKN